MWPTTVLYQTTEDDPDWVGSEFSWEVYHYNWDIPLMVLRWDYTGADWMNYDTLPKNWTLV